MSLGDVDSVLAEARARARPCVALRLGPSDATRIGGAPDLAGDLAWPQRDGRPLAFLAQLDCAVLGAAGTPDWFPEHGMLFVFYDLIEMPWGFDPDDAGGWAVVYDERGPAATRREVPDGVVDDPDDLPAERGLVGRAALSIPGSGRLDIAADDEEMGEAIDEALDAAMSEPFVDGVRHQIGGFPHAIQGDEMELDCQLVSHGIDCGSGNPYRTPRALALAPGADDWRLLLQLDTDGECNLFWVDCGRLYVWIREQDARAGRWDAAWVVLQCY